MPRSIRQTMRLFEVSPTSTTQSEVYTLERLQGRGFSHSTRLPGGFYEMRFSLPLTKGEFWAWVQDRRLRHMSVEDNSGFLIWDGRFERAEVQTVASGTWDVMVQCRGYWSNFTDDIDDATHSSAGATVIQNLRDNLDTDTLQLSTSNDEITASTPTINLDRSGSDRPAWETVKRVLDFADSSGNKVDLYIYEDREIQYKSRTPTSVDWHVSIEAGDMASLGFEWDWQDLYNAVQARYDNSGTPALSSESTNAQSISDTIKRIGRVGTTEITSSTSANAIRDAYLTQRANGLFVSESLRIKRVSDNNGVEQPICRIRAGDVIRIDDFLPDSGRLASGAPNSIDTFVITHTDCNHDRGTVTVTVDHDKRSLTGILNSNDVRPR